MATVGELDGKALVDIPAVKLSEIKAETLCYTLGHVDFGELLDTLAHTLAELQVEKPGNTPCDERKCTDRRTCLHGSGVKKKDTCRDTRCGG